MLDLLLLSFLVICAIAAIKTKDLLGSIILLTIYSLIMAIVWTRLNSVDVAFTEASVGAGITTVLLIAALSNLKREEDSHHKHSFFSSLSSLVIVVLVSAALLYGTIDMPDFGDPIAPANTHVAPRYIESSTYETGVINFVTAILAAYRGYDTLGETTVIFTAGLCVTMLLRKKMNK